MKDKIIKKGLKITLWALASILLMLVAFVFTLQFKPVQTYFAQKLAAYLAAELETRVEIRGLYLKPFKSLVLEDVYLQDLDEDTLLFAHELSLDINYLSLRNRKIAIRSAKLEKAKFFLKKYKDNSSNLTFIINYFNTGEPEIKKRKPFEISFKEILLSGVDFKYHNLKRQTKVQGINFNDLDIRGLKVRVLDLDTKHHLAKARIEGLSFREKSGFRLNKLDADATIDSNKMEFRELLIMTPKTTIRNYWLMKFRSFDDFNHYNDKVYMEGHFIKSRVLSGDIAYFAPELKKREIDVVLNGVVSGYVKNLRARRMSIQSGENTLLKGDFSVKGLPKIKNTRFELKFDQLLTSKSDYDQILKGITGNTNNRLPEEMVRLGKIRFEGTFSGFTDDFRAVGNFQTALGEVQADFKMKRDAERIPVYEGKIASNGFNLGDLLQRADLASTGLEGEFKGRGFRLKDLQNELKLRVNYFDFKNYRYQNITINGAVEQQVFNGRIDINDRNLELRFTGKMNLNPDLPEFNFDAKVAKADLFALHLLKDTIQFDGEVYTNFSGDRLDNIQGEIMARNLCINKLGKHYLIDSVYLAGKGFGNDRSIIVNSDLVDGSLKGKYDLSTLPSYFKSVMKKYIPSLQTNIVPFQPQHFELNLNLKNFEPIGLFVKDLKIPHGAVLNGKFDSDSNVSTINGYARMIQYKTIKANNLIVDEATEENQMNIFLTSDRIDLTDSIFVKNVNVANILRKDSLSLNIKLSDKDAVNQLDLNALVEFRKDSLARLNILPSDLVINREVWKIQEKVNINFDEGKAVLSNFGLSRNDQLITLNGTISSDPNDLLKVGFNKFKISTLNPLTKAENIRLKGEMNGTLGLRALTGKTRLSSALLIDSLDYNDNFIGKLNLGADYDHESKLASLNMSLDRHGIKSMDIQGTYDADPAQNNLDLDVIMDSSPLIILEPVVKRLVSDLKGTISSNLKVTGKPSNPEINGSISLNNASVTVNYLKTNYGINQKLNVTQSVIDINDLRLKDKFNHEAIANGTVDMRNPNNPNINVTLVANNFMALNTTAKDNSAYYGTAFGTGVFSFDGPTDNMSINIDAKTEEGTVFNIPLDDVERVNESDFIVFVSKDTVQTVTKQNFFKGLTMNFSLNVDESAQANIYTSLGRLSGRGRGDLSLRISTLGDFGMFGDYLISQGKFEFTAKDYINKVFDITQGGSIRWTGDPTAATINLEAKYGVRTSLSPLYTAAGMPADESRVQAEAVMNLSGNLLKPDIGFDLNFPSNSYVKDQLQSYLSDENNMNLQVLNLIVRRSFAPGNGTADLTNQINSTVLSAGTELAFNQLNNILSNSLNLNFVDFNIRSLNEASASFRLLNDRLVLTGGVTDRRSAISDLDVIGNDVARDFEAQYLIKKDGSIVIRASNRLGNRNSLNITNQEYVTAVGLVYRRDFDNFGEFVRQLIGQERRQDRLRQIEARSKEEAARRKKPAQD